MRKCDSYNIPCPYKLSDESPLSCFGSKEKCKKWREHYTKIQVVNEL